MADTKRKIAVVCSRSGLGRVGSSALMGLLKIGGLDVGGKASGLWAPNKYNPRGYFEIHGNKDCIHRIFSQFSDQFATPPTHTQIPSMIKLAENNLSDFEEFIDKEFNENSFIAIKGIRFFIFPFLHILASKYSIKVILLHRERSDQIKSILQLDTWKKHSNIIQKRCTQWHSFGTVMLNHFNEFDYLNVNFEKLINKPVQTANQITKFLNINSIPPAKVTKWIAPSITRRWTR